MKQIILKSITLSNFKGEKERTTDFNADVTTISGANGLGKSRHFDAFMWLLFGKDAQDRKDYEIKTRVDGEELHGIDCTVSGIISVDGADISLKRSFVEDWVKPRGQAERVYKGNHTECWWNDVPVNVSEYTKRVNGIVDDTVFKMVTNPAYFAGMDWKLQRQQLFLLAGTVTDEDIAKGNDDFTALLDAISGKSFADFKAEITAKRNRLKNELSQIQPRIDQTYKMMPEAPDFNALEARRAEIDAEISRIDQLIADASKALRAKYDEEQAKVTNMNALKLQQQKILFDATAADLARTDKANASRREIERTIQELEKDRRVCDIAIERQEKSQAAEMACVDRLNAELEKLRNEWYAENSRPFSGETECPYCHQPLPQSMIEESKTLFMHRKTEKCAEITARGKEIGKDIAGREEAIREAEKDIERNRREAEDIDAKIAAAKSRLAEMPAATGKDIRGEDLPEWVNLQKKIDGIAATVDRNESAEDSFAEMRAKKTELVSERDGILKGISTRDTIERAKKEISDLEDRGRELAQQIADIEKTELTMQKFMQAKIDECTSRINGMFSFVKFNLYNRTLDGNLVETCVPMVDGVPYPAANTAGRINAGLDIINSLCRLYGVTAPIFIDNRESVNTLIPTESQIINLVVTEDRELTVK